MNQSFFDASRPTAGGFSDRLYAGLGLEHGAPISEQDRADIAASVQRAVEDTVVRFAGEGENLCLGGGLMLNAPLVSALENSGRYKNVWVQPAAGNAGTSIGCAFYAWHQTCRKTERHPLDNLFLGPEYDREDIKQVLENCKLRFSYLTTDEAVISTAVKRLNDNQIVALVPGPYGVRVPRARQPQYLRFTAEPLLHREPQRLHQTPRAVPQVRCLGTGRTCV